MYLLLNWFLFIQSQPFDLSEIRRINVFAAACNVWKLTAGKKNVIKSNYISVWPFALIVCHCDKHFSVCDYYFFFYFLRNQTVSMCGSNGLWQHHTYREHFNVGEFFKFHVLFCLGVLWQLWVLYPSGGILFALSPDSLLHVHFLSPLHLLLLLLSKDY